MYKKPTTEDWCTRLCIERAWILYKGTVVLHSDHKCSKNYISDLISCSQYQVFLQILDQKPQQEENEQVLLHSHGSVKDNREFSRSDHVRLTLNYIYTHTKATDGMLSI